MIRGLLILTICLGLYTCAEPSAPQVAEAPLWYTGISDSAVFGRQLGSFTQDAIGADTTIFFDSCSNCPDSISISSKSYGPLTTDIRLSLPLVNMDSTSLFNELREHLDRTYGQSSPSEGYVTWKTAAPDGRLVEVSLTDDRMLFQRERLTLDWHLVQDRLYED